jgi:hypothetical protein
MTKQQMINQLRHREEAKWIRYEETKALFGEANPSTVSQRQEWNETYRILGELGITTLGQERLKGYRKASRLAEQEVRRIRQTA